MIHKVKYGYMEVVPESSLPTDRRAPDLTFKGAGDREFVVFFASYGTTEAEKMQPRHYEHVEVIGDAIIDAETEEAVSDDKAL